MKEKYLNKEIYLDKVKRLNDPYWNRSYETRWQYMQDVLKEIDDYEFCWILEIGAYKINYTDISHNMDVNADFIDPDNKDNTMFIQDAGDVPYPIQDNQYELVLACQCFEHFEGKQAQAFQEIKRITSHAVITIPWQWNCPEDKNHHNINESHCLKWFGTDYKDFLIRDSMKAHRRLLHFKF